MKWNGDIPVSRAMSGMDSRRPRTSRSISRDRQRRVKASGGSSIGSSLQAWEVGRQLVRLTSVKSASFHPVAADFHVAPTAGAILAGIEEEPAAGFAGAAPELC